MSNRLTDGEKLDKVLEDALSRVDDVYVDDLAWYAFPQMWPSTALGFNSAGGSAMTTATTTAVFHSSGCEVYFGGRWAYSLDYAEGRKYLQKQNFPSCYELNK